MRSNIRGILIGLCALLMTVALVAQPMPKTTKQDIKGSATVTTESLAGTVLLVEGNTLLVRMNSGEVKKFDPPDSRRFIVDGKELTVHELKPGTKLHATMTTTTTPVTERTTTVGTGKVWFVSGNTVILTLPNNENRMYKVAESYRFMVNGEKATVHDLRKGMTVSAEKIVEVPRTDIAADVTVTGEAPPPPRPVMAKSAPPAERPAPAPARAAAHTPEPAPAPVAEAQAEPTKLPKTGSPVPLFGLLGFLCTGAAFSLRALRRK